MELKFLPIEEKHLELIRNWRNSEEVKKYMYTDKNITEPEQKQWYQSKLLKDDEKHWIVECNGNLVGVVNLKKIDVNNKTAEWAFYLGEGNTRGSGIGVMIEYNLLNYVFNELSYHKLNCAVFDFNEAVIELHKKFGFAEEGRLRKQMLKNGEYHDVVLLGILKDEWLMNRNKMTRIIDRLKVK